MKRRELQPAHEESVLESFGHYLQEHGKSLAVINRPDPPDAIVKIENELCWIEITDAFQSPEWAKSITSSEAEDKPHHPYRRDLMYEPDQVACEKVKEVILKKYDKETMITLCHEKGLGILLVGVYTPLTSMDEIIKQSKETILYELEEREAIFKSIYLYQNSWDGLSFLKFL